MREDLEEACRQGKVLRTQPKTAGKPHHAQVAGELSTTDTASPIQMGTLCPALDSYTGAQPHCVALERRCTTSWMQRCRVKHIAHPLERWDPSLMNPLPH